MSRITRLVIVPMVSLLLLAACASSQQDNSLQATLRNYEAAVRWSQWDGTVDFLAPEYLRENPVTRLDLDRLRLFRVTQYVVRSMIPSADGQSVVQTVEIRMFNRNQAVERGLVDRQVWRFDKDRERWLLHSGLPDVTQAR